MDFKIVLKYMNLSFTNYLNNNLSCHIKQIKNTQDEITLSCNFHDLHNILLFLKHDESCLFYFLTDIFAIDYPSNKKRFKIVYNLLSPRYNKRIVIYSTVSEIEVVNSIIDLYKNANWLEREIWDMHGIYFENHSDLRRILTDYGFHGFPLRKDFPLSGYFEVRYDESQKRVVFETIELTQEFRTFRFDTPWK